MNIQTYLFFDGRCEEAIRFYSEVFGAETQFLMRYKEGPPSMLRPGNEEHVFHATVKFGETTINMSDALSTEHTDFGGFALLIHLDSIEEAECVFSRLGEAGQIRVPLEQNPWALRYGIIRDRFGITWKIQVNN